MSGLPTYRVEWRVAAAGGAAGHVTRWSGYENPHQARSAALEIAITSAIDGEIRIARAAGEGSNAEAVITDARALEGWRCDLASLPNPKQETSWNRQRVKAGLRGAVLLSCRQALSRGVDGGLLTKAQAANALGVIALALDGEDLAALVGLRD